MNINPTLSGGRVVKGDTPYGRFRFEVDSDGALVSHEFKVLEPRPPQAIPDDFNINTERRRLKQGGCCGKPSG